MPIDLTGMGAQTRSLANVIIYMNQQLAAAGVQTRVATDRIPGTPQTITAGGTTVTLPDSPDQFAMQVNIGIERAPFRSGAPQTANAVYIGADGRQSEAPTAIRAPTIPTPTPSC